MGERLLRDAWTDTAPGGSPMDSTEVDGLAVHWNGPGLSAAVNAGDKEAVRRYLVAIRRFHVVTNGWSDIAYQWAVDQAGRRWECRGWRKRSAANGDTGPNRRFGAVLAIIGEGQKPTPQLLEGLAEARADFRHVFPKATLLKTHRQVRPEPTECPGPDLTRWVFAGGPANLEDDVTPEDIKSIAEAVWDAQVSRGDQSERAGVWLAYTNYKADRILAGIDPEAFADKVAARLSGSVDLSQEDVVAAVKRALREGTTPA